ncbi:hypothetical protein SCLCIDRAFT_250542 [Scleroderma citrinum Foug A]|uniref:Uncharacterized protein n=1 Tax=Scleroderma citrinum Foug A TaxID=1036808 RepID=A0A0C2Z2T6_9AGAM|nr:hypothetical protein SCLCIDRAFT_250542 [Scleroderma citrinum Foug A]
MAPVCSELDGENGVFSISIPISCTQRLIFLPGNSIASGITTCLFLTTSHHGHVRQSADLSDKYGADI